MRTHHDIDGVSTSSLSLAANSAVAKHEGLGSFAFDFKADGTTMAWPFQLHSTLFRSRRIEAEGLELMCCLPWRSA